MVDDLDESCYVEYAWETQSLDIISGNLTATAWVKSDVDTDPYISAEDPPSWFMVANIGPQDGT